MENLDPNELLERAEALIPALRERALGQEALRSLSPDTVADFEKGKFIRALQPKRWGGYEMHPNAYAKVQMALGRGDLSACWVFGVYTGHTYHLAFFDERAQRDVWGENPDARIASPYAPNGKAVPVKDGYRLTGRWKFSSGSVHTDWIMLGAMTVEDKPQMRVMLLPRKDYEVVDVWTVVGLRATGSNDIVVEDVFIPSYRTLPFPAPELEWWPGNDTNPGLLYRIPYMQLFYRALLSGALGGLEAMLDGVVAYTAGKVSARMTATAPDPDLHLACAQALSGLDEMKTIMFRNFDRLMALAADGKRPSITDRRLMKYQACVVPSRCLTHVRALFEATGGLGIFQQSGPFERIYRDLVAMNSHAASQHNAFGRQLGEEMVGRPSADISY